MTLCERFPSLSPFDIRKQSVYEVFLLVRRLSNYNKSRENIKVKPNEQVLRDKKTNEIIIRRPADNSWY